MIIVNILTTLCIVIGVGFCLYVFWGTLSYVFKGIKKAIDEYKDEKLSKKVPKNPTISFEKFKELYAINPDKWECYDTYVSYKIIEECPTYKGYPVTYETYYTSTKRIDIYFETSKDIKKYNQWRQKQENEKNRENVNKLYSIVLEDIQKDVRKRLDEIEAERKKELERIEAERKANERKYVEYMANSNATVTISNNNTSDLIFQPIVAFDALKQEVAQLKQDLLELVPFSQEGVNFMYEGNLCELFVQKGSGDIYVKTPDNNFRLLREITPTPLIYFKEQDAHLLKDIENDLNKEWK